MKEKTDIKVESKMEEDMTILTIKVKYVMKQYACPEVTKSIQP